MSIVNLAIKRPAFTTSVMIILVVVGLICFKQMDVNLFPEVRIPTIYVATVYTGAAPTEIETLVSKPLEEEISSVSGIKTITSKSLKDTSQVIITFNDNVDIKYAEQQVRDRVNQAKPKLPLDVKESIIRRLDPADQPILTISVNADLSPYELYDLANQYIKPRIEQVGSVGLVEILGGRKREIAVLLDQNLLKKRSISLSQVRQKLAESGENVPIGKVSDTTNELVYSSDSEFNDLKKVENVIVSFYSNEVPTKISDIGQVVDGLEDEYSRTFVNGKKSLFINVYRQSDSNIIKVVDGVNEQIERMKTDFVAMKGRPEIVAVADSSKYIRNNVHDVYEIIFISIVLTILVIFFFLANSRATIIVSIALPIAFISAFIAMYVAGFSINIISLLALSLAIGLLVDDAIVVTENIYRKIEHGLHPIKAAYEATTEIMMAVVAITLVVVAVFLPVGFMNGIVGQYMKEFGLTMAFSMMVSFVVAITIIPVLCAYFADIKKITHREGGWIITRAVKKFDDFQNYLEAKYEKILHYTIDKPKNILLSTLAIFVLCMSTIAFIPKTFIAENDNGEISVSLELPASASLDYATQTAQKMDKIIRANKEVVISAVTVGNGFKQSNRGSIYVRIAHDRNITTVDFREKLRMQLKEFAYANPVVKDYDPSGGASRTQPFNLYLISNNAAALEKYAQELIIKLKQDPRLKDVDSSNKSMRNEFGIRVKERAAKIYGVNHQAIGEELRGYVEGYVPTKFRQNGLEYDLRVRLQEDQRDLRKNFSNIFVPNFNQKLIRLADIAEGRETQEAATINRQDRGRYIQITASLAPKAGLGDIIDDVTKIFSDEATKLPNDIRYKFSGDSENMKNMIESFKTAMLIALIFIYLILASLYESFITPFTILLALPLALCGAILAVFLTGESLNIFTFLGVFLLLGVSGKNSILLVDFAHQMIDEGKTRKEALIRAGVVRLRPILMTSFALIAGTIPVAIGISEAAKPRTSMGIAIIGGLISSTILTLIVVPAVFSYVDRFRLWLKEKFAPFVNK
ncbi:MAG: efflux RND transporter permease subunit [Rickettsiales bacterium]|nr:efflux RND transporter permease subunit [Rickettsiales bacterium]